MYIWLFKNPIMKKCFFLLSLGLVLTIAVSAQSKYDALYYFPESESPNGTHFLPPPPEEGTPLHDYDLKRHEWAKSFRGTEREARALRESATEIDEMAAQFSGAFGMEISPEKTPAIFHVLERGVVTMRLSATQPKAHYMRKRPFVVFNESTITPEGDESLGKTGSYPSGHSLRGWGMALILSEINPAAQDTLLRFGYEWGQSRVIGNYHWQSDVDASRLLASAAFAHLHSTPLFLEDLDKAKREFATLKGLDAALEDLARRRYEALTGEPLPEGGCSCCTGKSYYQRLTN